jgi:WhiB family transcriptional regulator, redox-sensing transcriptional regulator
VSTRALRPPRWTERAVCVQVDPDVFFPGKGEAAEPAKRLCRSCEVRLPCLAGALERYDEYGVFGGFSAEQREAVRRKQRAGRSLADIIAEDDAAYYGRQERAA